MKSSTFKPGLNVNRHNLKCRPRSCVNPPPPQPMSGFRYPSQDGAPSFRVRPRIEERLSLHVNMGWNHVLKQEWTRTATSVKCVNATWNFLGYLFGIQGDQENYEEAYPFELYSVRILLQGCTSQHHRPTLAFWVERSLLKIKAKLNQNWWRKNVSINSKWFFALVNENMSFISDEEWSVLSIGHRLFSDNSSLIFSTIMWRQLFCDQSTMYVSVHEYD